MRLNLLNWALQSGEIDLVINPQMPSDVDKNSRSNNQTEQADPKYRSDILAFPWNAGMTGGQIILP